MENFTVPQRNVEPNWGAVFVEDKGDGCDSKLTKCVIKKAKKTGILNMSNKGLSKIPDRVYTLNDPDEDNSVTLESLSIPEEDAWWNEKPMTCLDFSSNQITGISPKIQFLASLTTLTLHDNNISCIPEAIHHCEKLIRVNLCRNNLKSLPTEFFRLKYLRYLNLSYNKLSCLSADISDLNNLEILDVSFNQIDSIPGGIGFLSRLTELYASNNEISDVPPDITSVLCLQILDLMNNKIPNLPEGLQQLRKLKLLYIKNNEIANFPDIAGCECLVELHAGSNCIRKIPKDICTKLPHLQLLELSCNSIEEIPDHIVYLQNLTKLDLSNNNITDLPHCLTHLPNLRSLQVEGNPIRKIRSDIIQRGTTGILKALRDRANLATCCDMAGDYGQSLVQGSVGSPGSAGSMGSAASFPDKYKMRKTNILAVNNANLTEAPDDVFQIANEERIRMVDFSKNRFHTLPKGLGCMKDSVTEINFANNAICYVPALIADLRFLSILNLSCNLLSTLPAEMKSLEQLRDLNLNNNRFVEIPQCIYNLPALQVLQLSDNKIKNIDASPEGLGAMKSLCTLNLRNNNIEQVPPILGTLRNITTLEILGNAFRLPRHQILVKGTEAIMSYLRDRIPA